MTRLQQLIIEKVSSINNPALLQEINRLLETGVESEEYKLSPDQEKALAEARTQIKEGNFLTQDEADKQTEEWLRNQ